jgi:CRISPR-associated endoribonuclease Cas2
MSKYLYCYDIADAKRLRLVSKELDKKGYRIQKSFFLLDKDVQDVAEILSAILSVLDIQKDKLAVYQFCDKCFSDAIFLGDQAPEWFYNDYMVL